MAFTDHLNIPLEEYDTRISTFVPTHDEMIMTVAKTLMLMDKPDPHIVDLGTGTGKLARECLKVRPRASVTGIDLDPAMLALARTRLAQNPRTTFIEGNFQNIPIPRCDAIVACISLHHIKSPAKKQALYRRCRKALRKGGLFISADCFPARNKRLARIQREAWLAHMEQTYSPAEAKAHLESWADEDAYMPLENELRWLTKAGFRTEVVWRKNAFGVVVGV